MSIHISADPYADFDSWDAEQQRALDALPHCDMCGEPIQDEYYYDFGNEIMCDECLNEYRRMNNFV